MREMLLIDAMSTCTERFVLFGPPVLARLKPSTVMGVWTEGTPSMTMPRA